MYFVQAHTAIAGYLIMVIKEFRGVNFFDWTRAGANTFASAIMQFGRTKFGLLRRERSTHDNGRESRSNEHYD